MYRQSIIPTAEQLAAVVLPTERNAKSASGRYRVLENNAHGVTYLDNDTLFFERDLEAVRIGEAQALARQEQAANLKRNWATLERLTSW